MGIWRRNFKVVENEHFKMFVFYKQKPAKQFAGFLRNILLLFLNFRCCRLGSQCSLKGTADALGVVRNKQGFSG